MGRVIDGLFYTLVFQKIFCEFCQFCHVIKKDKGYIIAFSFSKGAYEEAARIKKEGLFIDLLAVDKLLGFSEERVSDLKFEFY